MSMKMVTVSELKVRLADIVAQLDRDATTFYVTQHGKPKAVLVKYEEYEALREKMDDLEDALAMQQSQASPEDESLGVDEYERQRPARLRG